MPKMPSFLSCTKMNCSLRTEEIKTQDLTALIFRSKQILDFLMAHRAEINSMVKERAGYIGKQ